MVLSSRLSIKSSKSHKSDYEYDSQFGDGEEDASVASPLTFLSLLQSSQSEDFDNFGRRPSAISDTSAFSSDSYLSAAERALSKLQDLHSSPDSAWKRALKHKESGTVVYVTKEKSYVSPGRNEGSKGFYAPVFKSVLDIDGFTPPAVFGVVGTRKLWDDWYKEGSLVENLSNDSSLTYMCMKGIAGSSTRDLSLVEKVQGSPTGTICFATTSIVTPKVPRVAGRVRASIALNGWVIEPIRGGTRVSYYLHVNVKTFIPSFAATKYLARRPTCIAKIAEYLHSHGAPPLVPVEPEPTPSALVPSATFTSVAPSSVSKRRRDSVSSKRSNRSSTSTLATTVSAGSAVVGLPSHVELDRDAASYGEVQTAIKLFRAMLASSEGGEWTMARDQEGSKVWMRERNDRTGLPVVKGEAEIEGDPRIETTQLIGLHNGFDQGTFVESQKGIFPSLKSAQPYHHVVARGVDRDDSSDPHGTILLVSRSTDASDARRPPGSTPARVDFAGFLLSPASSRSVRLIRLGQLDTGGGPLTPATHKILTTEIALAPRRVAEFIDAHGFAPHFLRWGSGPAELLADTAPGDDVKRGRVTFVIGGRGQGTMRDGKQKCWLAWSPKMYPRGIDVRLEPPDSGELAKVEGGGGRDGGTGTTMLEICWTEKVKEGARLVLCQAADGNGFEDVFVRGEFLDRTVRGEPGAAGGARKRLERQRKESSGMTKSNGILGDETVVGVAAVGAAAAGAVMQNRSSKVANGAPPAVGREVNGMNGLHDAENKVCLDRFPLSCALAFLASVRRAEAFVFFLLAQLLTSNKVTSSSASHATAALTAAASTSSLPPNACLIISKDLYFTQQQVVFMVALVAVAYVWGKVA
ncbi:SPOSA6832_02351 [Sporobolomyces salmonicolor]|uniref:SPOSA6832_02351-mRNA-1:cds n=1 Tax=Sporidiobolus salmonicolor TaxID=5005 RepID=A0A0D6EL68_SPOSA|nr:SPOSA6832_02351 [Sporobolomyces salmonicolor]